MAMSCLAVRQSSCLGCHHGNMGVVVSTVHFPCFLFFLSTVLSYWENIGFEPCYNNVNLMFLTDVREVRMIPKVWVWNKISFFPPCIYIASLSECSGRIEIGHIKIPVIKCRLFLVHYIIFKESLICQSKWEMNEKCRKICVGVQSPGSWKLSVTDVSTGSCVQRMINAVKEWNWINLKRRSQEDVIMRGLSLRENLSRCFIIWTPFSKTFNSNIHPIGVLLI